MTVHRNIDDLCLCIRHLASSLKLKEPIPFELASVYVQHYDSDCASEFAGFGRDLVGKILYQMGCSPVECSLQRRLLIMHAIAPSAMKFLLSHLIQSPPHRKKASTS